MVIELTSVLAQDFDIILDGVSVRMSLDFNERLQLWSFGVFTPEDEPLLVGKPLRIGVPLLNADRPGLPAGLLTLVHESGELVAPTRDNLGQFFLHYLTQDEFEADLLEALQ